MPRYEFYCNDCQKPFEIILTLAEYEKGKPAMSARCTEEAVATSEAALGTRENEAESESVGRS